MSEETDEFGNEYMIDILSNDTHFKSIGKPVLNLATAITTINLFFIFLTIYLLLQRIIKLRKPLQLYIQNIVFCNFFVAGGHLVGAVRCLVKYNSESPSSQNGTGLDSVCVFQSIFTTYANLATFFWMMMIEWSSYRLMMNKPAPLKRGSWFVHLLCWLIPAFIVSFAVVNDVLGEDLALSGPGYCWIQHNHKWKNHLLWGLLTAKGWELITIIATVNFYFYNFCFFKRHTVNDFDILLSHDPERMEADGDYLEGEETEADQADLLWECRGLAILPLNLMILRIWGTTRFWIDISLEMNSNQKLEQVSLVLLYFQSIGDSSLAFFNFVLLTIVKWSQVTDAYPFLKRFRPCQWLSERQPLSAFEHSQNPSATIRRNELRGYGNTR